MARAFRRSLIVFVVAIVIGQFLSKDCNAQPRWAAIQVENRTGATINLWWWYDGSWRRPSFNLRNGQWTQWLINKNYYIYAYSPGIDGYIVAPLNLRAIYQRNHSAVVEIRTTNTIWSRGRLSKKYAVYVKVPIQRDSAGRVVHWKWYRYHDFLS